MKTTTNQKFIIRCDRAGVFYAELASRTGDEAVLRNARRIYYWTGAATLSQLALEGVKSGSKLTVAVPEMTVLGVIEVIPAAEAAVLNLDKVEPWRV
jgi:hypothetical protein